MSSFYFDWTVSTSTICIVFLDKSGAKILVPESWGSCGVRLGREKNQTLSFFSRYDSCYAEIEVN